MASTLVSGFHSSELGKLRHVYAEYQKKLGFQNLTPLTRNVGLAKGEVLPQATSSYRKRDEGGWFLRRRRAGWGEAAGPTLRRALTQSVADAFRVPK